MADWLSRILAPVAFSPRCRGATQYAEALACHFHSELTLLHVFGVPVTAFTSAEAFAISTADAWTGERLERTKQELRQYLCGHCPEIPLTREVIAGDPAPTIVDYARQHQTDLIVMATHGYGPFRRLILGSVTAKVLDQAACPVWTGPHLEDAPGYEKIRFRSVLCAVDLTDGSAAVLRWGRRFARAFDARFQILHVLPRIPMHLGLIDPRELERSAAMARDHIARLQEEAGTDADVTLETGNIPRVVSDMAACAKADLLVIGRGREAGELRLGPHAYALIRESPCPVVTV